MHDLLHGCWHLLLLRRENRALPGAWALKLLLCDPRGRVLRERTLVAMSFSDHPVLAAVQRASTRAACRQQAVDWVTEIRLSELP